MAGAKATGIWVVNIVSFIFFCILAFTGMINWLVLTHGNRGGGALMSLRHFLMNFHAWAGLLFVVIIVIHLALHWNYIKTKLTRSGLLK